MYINKLENEITFKIKTGYYLELLTPGTMKSHWSAKCKTYKDKNVENFPHLEITEIFLIHFNTVSKDYHQDSRVLYTFTPSESFDQFVDISPKTFIFLKTFNSQFSYIEVWFTDQNSKPLEREHKINSALVIN